MSEYRRGETGRMDELLALYECSEGGIDGDGTELISSIVDMSEHADQVSLGETTLLDLMG